jgi:hypothetical protein
VIWSEREVSLMASSLLAVQTSEFENNPGKAWGLQTLSVET